MFRKLMLAVVLGVAGELGAAAVRRAEEKRKAGSQADARQLRRNVQEVARVARERGELLAQARQLLDDVAEVVARRKGLSLGAGAEFVRQRLEESAPLLANLHAEPLPPLRPGAPPPPSSDTSDERRPRRRPARASGR